MKCLYKEELPEESTETDVRATIKLMVEIITGANPGEYVDVRFPRKFYALILSRLKYHRRIGIDKNVSCEMHVIQDKIMLELMRNEN